MNIRNGFIFLMVLVSPSFLAQVSNDINVLFLGNSYTAYNNLPQLVADCAASTGRSLTFQSNTPGGQTFEGHLNNTTSMNLVAQGNWDFVVLQEQSQLPSFPDFQVEQDVYPFATKLNDTINYFNNCAETVFYMTWGRENGDAQNCANWPPVCTYEGMDDLLNERYRQMAEDNEAILSPVGALWRSIRANYPEIDLYANDGSHPSPTGSYAAAVCFYTVLFRADPLEISFNYSIDETSAASIRQEAKTIVFDQLLDEWHVGEYDETMSPCFNTVAIQEKAEENAEHHFVTSVNGELIFQNISSPSMISCFDISGKLIHQIRIQADGRSLLQLPSGIYIFHLEDQFGRNLNQKIALP